MRWTRLVSAVATTVAIAGTWNVCEAQKNLGRVLAFDSVVQGTDDDRIQWPIALAARSDRELLVADAYGSRLLVFNRTGPNWTLDRTVDLPSTPIDIATDGSSYLVSLRGAQGLLLFEGSKLTQRSIKVPDGVVVGPLASLGNGRWLVFDYAGSKVITLAASGDIESEVPIGAHLTGIVATPIGGFFASVATEGKIIRYDADGNVAAEWHLAGDGPAPAWPAGLAVNVNGDVAVIDRHGSRIIVLDGRGEVMGVGSRQGQEPGLLKTPSDITLLPDGRLAVADQGNSRIQIFRRIDRRTGM